jgi:hypothetical protein
MIINWNSKLRSFGRSSSARAVFQKHWRTNEQNLDAVSNAVSAARGRETGIDGLDAILNVNQFLSILNYDLSIVQYELVTLEAGWRKSFHARVAALLCVEFMEDVGQLIGKEWRASIAQLLTGKKDHESLRQICKALSDLRSKHERHLRTLRNVAIGHRDKDTALQLKAIREMDLELIRQILLDVIKWMTVMMMFQTDLMHEVVRRLPPKTNSNS